MKKKSIFLLFSAAALMLSACGAAEENNTSGDGTAASPAASSTGNTMSENEGEAMESTENKEENTADSAGAVRRISVQFGENTVIYELNDSSAADSLYEQLPITTEVEDFSTNEKIFYPSRELDISDTPTAEGGAGTLAYYAPWGDVVMFYDDYSVNASLFELGQAVSGVEQIGEMSGTIVIDTEIPR